MSDIEFVDGLLVKAPREGAPDFVKGSISIKRTALITYLTDKKEDWINMDIKESKGGKWYAAVNDWKPKESRNQAHQASQSFQEPSQPLVEEGFDDSDIPF